MKEGAERTLLKTVMIVMGIFSAVAAAANILTQCIITRHFKIRCPKEVSHLQTSGDSNTMTNILISVKDIITSSNTASMFFVFAICIFVWALVKKFKISKR